jgi:hypothetical protein
MTDRDTASAAHAVWSSPDCFYSVRYPRPLFQEIEFVVKESSNRISYGGLEVGGFLFGRLAEGSDNPSVQIEAFRNIECEHAYGPSFRLSERDLSGMREQLVRAGSDPELEGLRLVGWFISHSRNSLQLSEQEVTLFNRLFPRPGQLTILVKPDRFKATQFAFLVREPGGGLERDGARFSVTLGFGTGLGTRVSPIEKIQSDVPVADEAPSPPKPEPKPEQPEEVAAPVDAVPPVVVPEIKSEAAEATPAVIAEPEKRAGDELVFQTTTAEEKAVQPEPPTETKTEAKPPDTGVTPATPKVSDKHAMQPGQIVSDTRSETAESEVEEESETIRKRREDILSAFRDVEAQLIERQVDLQYPFGPRRSARIKSWLWVAAVITVCLAGYWAYARLFLSTLTMDLHIAEDRTAGSKVIVSWPAEETNVSVPATIRVNNGTPVPLSAEDKVLGRTEVPVSGDEMKVEIVIHHWSHDTRGIVRYVKLPGMP